MKFTKMHGTGNDYIYINCFEEKIENPSELAIKLSNRNFGIGSDGLILIKPGRLCEFEMDMYNADGSVAQMCGNGLRCVAKYVYDNNMSSKKVFDIETRAGVKSVSIEEKEGKAYFITIDMGIPILQASDIPINGFSGRVINKEIEVLDTTFTFTSLSMGNPHCVIFLSTESELDNFPILQYGPLIENHSFFPNRVNTEFVFIRSRTEVKQRTFERGSGETLACGTGACATLVAGVLNGLLDKEITNHLRGGDVFLKMDKEDHIFLKGSATTVFEGRLS